MASRRWLFLRCCTRRWSRSMSESSSSRVPASCPEKMPNVLWQVWQSLHFFCAVDKTRHILDRFVKDIHLSFTMYYNLLYISKEIYKNLKKINHGSIGKTQHRCVFDHNWLSSVVFMWNRSCSCAVLLPLTDVYHLTSQSNSLPTQPLTMKDTHRCTDKFISV